MPDTAHSLLEKYLSETVSYWGNNTRQAEKTHRRVAKNRNYYGYSLEQFIKFISKISEERIAEKIRTLYISSNGSSGSHLLQHLVCLSVPALPLGEVYKPVTLTKEVAGLPVNEKKKFMEMYHLCHCAEPWMLPSKGVIVNTAHQANVELFAQHTKYWTSLILLRHPAEIALSRTFRKDEYRRYLGKDGVSDESYLDSNIERTSRFFTQARTSNFHSGVRFEDMFRAETQIQVCQRLANVLCQPDYSTVFQSNIRSALCSDKTKKFHGKKAEISEYYIERAYSNTERVVKVVNEICDRLNIKGSY